MNNDKGGAGGDIPMSEAMKSEKVEPVLIVGTIPCMSDLVRAAWEMCKEASGQLARVAGNQYEAYDVYRALFFGHAHFYVAYMCDSKEDAEFAAKSIENANLVIAKYITLKKDDGFVGFAVVRLDERLAHIWQAYMTKKYRGTDVFDACFKVIEDSMNSIGVPEMTFETMRQGLGSRVEKIGYREGMTTFHKTLAEKEESSILV